MSEAALADMFMDFGNGWSNGPSTTTRRFGRRQPNPTHFVSAEPCRHVAVEILDASDVVCELAEEAALTSKIEELAIQTAVTDWDGERGEAINRRQWEDVRRIALKAAQELRGVPAPFVSACGDGSAHLQWTTPRGNRGVIEIGISTCFWSFMPISDLDGVDEVLELHSPDEALLKVQALFIRA